MASIRQSIRSSTASKRPTSAIADGQIALNTASGTPGMFFKDSAGNIIKAGPAHYGASAPNSSPGVGGSTGNSIGEAWLDSSLTPAGWKIWNGSAFVNATPLSSDTVQGLVELATNAETQSGVDTARAVTSASLQSKVSDSISTASASGIASSTAVKTAYDLANAALPKSGGIITGNLEIGSTGSFTFEGSTADGFETTLAVVDPTLDRTITFPNITGTVVTTGDTGTVTSTMILDGTILNADVNASAAIAGTKISPDFGSQNTTTTGTSTAASFIPTSSSVPTNGVYLPAANSVAISTSGIGRLFVDSVGSVCTAGQLGVGTSSPSNTYRATINGNGSSVVGGLSLRNNNTETLSIGTVTAVNDVDNEIWSPRNGYLRFATNNNERLRITSAGLVGIGISGPSKNLDIASTYRLQIDTASALYGPAITMGGDNGASQSGAQIVAGYEGGWGLSFRLSSNSQIGLASDPSLLTYATKMRLTSTGLGIGTTSPATLLDLSTTTSAKLNLTYPGFGIATLASDSSGALLLQADEANTQASSLIQFKVDGSEAARIDSSRRLLVGTSSARGPGDHIGRLQVEGTGYATSTASIFANSNDAFGSYLFLGKSRGTAVGSNTIVQSGDSIGQIRFSGTDGTGIISGAFIESFVDGTPGTNDMPGRLVFSTTADGASSPTERMRIDNGGNIFWGPLSGGDYPNYLVADGSIRSTKTYNATTASAANTFISSNGTLARSTSSIKYKTNVETIEDQYADAILGCRPVWYQSTSEADNPEWGHWGFIAEEVVQIDPRLCFFKEEEDGTLEPEGVQYDRFVPHLLNLIKRQQQAIETLEASNADMLARLSALEGA